MSETVNARVIITVQGIVQGVGFRYFVHRNARKLAVTGTVQNLPGNKVLTIAEGKKEALQDLLALVKEGPAGAWVKDYTVEWAVYSGEFHEFSIIH